ncbi:hypothetical protein E4U43_005654 [Claviceps pusilla]|uniref:C2H2-type domain-containing protein n=1 Tax=Claviceps pusilla TaxID=123648 RepID=A0A9P7SZY6_9HYPO|nr:hypothetical protein E4U43_005654 [Claviceps pusilla]
MVMNDDDAVSKAVSPESRYAHILLQYGRHVRSIWFRSFRRNVVVTSSPAAHTTVLRRDLSDGAVAGTVLGALVAAVLVAFCLYPVIVHQIKRRERAGRPLDAEAGSLQADHHIKGSTLDPHPHRRLSSTDSFKQDGGLSRGELGEAIPSAESDRTRDDANAEQTQREENFDATGQLPSATGGGDGCEHVEDDAFDHDYRNEPTPFPYYMPASIPDDNPGVLNGTSDDYYRPSIPSSAFGMVAAPDPVAPVRTLPRPSSLKHNLKQLFSRSGGRDTSLASASNDQSTFSRAYPGNELGQTVTSELSPTATSTQLPPAPLSAVAVASLSAFPSPPPAAEAHHAAKLPSQHIAPTPPQSPRPDRSAFKASPSPPSDPAPGTVNPMDIMPASTQSEMRHRTEHQLLGTSYGSAGGLSSAGDQASLEDIPTSTPPARAPASPVPALFPAVAAAAEATHPFLTPPNQNTLQPGLKREHYDVSMLDVPSHNHPSPSMIAETGTSRHPSYPSDQSTPLPGAHSTGSSAENTPSTQLDSPSPRSVHSSNFRHSTSPQPGPGLASPTRAGLFRCDEPGCSQAFDQPHKLKHHQRYHSKDHKCPYKDCGKGFGTKTHLQRHINDRHEKKKKFHCAIPGCDYSKSGGKAFPRKDNWKRHMTKIHNVDQQQLPDPIEVDSEMGGI